MEDLGESGGGGGGRARVRFVAAAAAARANVFPRRESSPARLLRLPPGSVVVVVVVVGEREPLALLHYQEWQMVFDRHVLSAIFWAYLYNEVGVNTPRLYIFPSHWQLGKASTVPIVTRFVSLRFEPDINRKEASSSNLMLGSNFRLRFYRHPVRS